jgi:flagellar protein FlaG
MSQEISQPNVILERTPDYREGYANSVQVQKSVWDFRLTFGTAYQETAEQITINTFQTVYLSPQQAKALCNVLEQNLLQYEHTFGAISLEPRPPVMPQGPVH